MKPDATPKQAEISLPSVNQNVLSYYAARRQRLNIVKTTQTPSGQIIDWIPIESQGPIATPPAAAGKVESKHEDVRSTAVEAMFELQVHGLERGPEGTVPVLRPRRPLAGKFEDFRRKRKVDGRRLMKDPGVPPPDPAGYYHATAAASATCFGCLSVLSLWDPHCENDLDHSISQFGIQNYDNPQLQSLEAGWIASKGQFGDNLIHLFTYYTTNGYTKNGDNQGGYNTDYEGFVQVDRNIYPGAGLTHVDWPGVPAYEMQIHFDLNEGNWWFYVGNTAVGYYPAKLFGSTAGKTLADHGDWCGFWGEVYSADKDPSQTTTSMGSGYHATLKWPWAAYQRDMFVTNYRGLGKFKPVPFKPQPALITSSEDSTMYDVLLNPSPFDGFMFFGGAGKGTPWVNVNWPL